MSNLRAELSSQVNSFQAGAISSKLQNWQDLTSDTSILQTVAGLPIDFINSPPPQRNLHNGDHFSKMEHAFIQKELIRLEKLGVIKKSVHETGEYISPVFLTPKSDGGFRLILNLKELNRFCPYVHFKMDTIDKVLTLVTRNCFFGKIDIKDAYYSVKIAESFKKYLKFCYGGILYQFTCLPNGLSEGPRKFTKLLKPPLAFLRQAQCIVSGYIDDLITLGHSFQKSFENIVKIVKLFKKLGFVLHPEKSVFIPVQIIEYLGFVINSISMIITLTEKRKKRIKNLCNTLLSQEHCIIRDVAKLLGYFSSSFVAVRFGKLHYRNLERNKIAALQRNQGNFDASMTLSSDAKSDIIWWEKNIIESSNEIYNGLPAITLTTDACPTGWGAVTRGNRTSGIFSAFEQDQHINVLELKAVLFGLKALIPYTNTHIKVLSDNTTTVHCINNMGSCKSIECDLITTDIWEWTRVTNNWLIASHIPGVFNEEADIESRKNEFRLEWKLDKNVFDDIMQHFSFHPDIDLFASRLNTQLPKFVSFRPDPEALHVNAFTISWEGQNVYIFPPFSCIGKVIQKMNNENVSAVLVVPNRPNQPWYPCLMNIIADEPLIIHSSAKHLHLPSDPSQTHPLLHLDLMACLVLT